MASQNRTVLPKSSTVPLRKAPTPDTQGLSEPGTGANVSWMLLLFPLAYLWFRLIDNLRLEWTTNPQYAFGWVVPLLCLGLVIRKWHCLAKMPLAKPSKPFLVLLYFAFLAFLYLPTRLVEASTPEWRPIQWMLGIEAIGLTLCAIRLGKGQSWFRQLAFPIAFFFVAIPWPTLFEIPIIQGLTRVSVALVVELLGWAGIPALPHGNVIQVSTGMVGIDEACSGIRSFQSSLMISLFLGEFYVLTRFRRWLLVPMGIVLALALNVTRMFVLTLIAAKKGVAAISHYHDPAGITIAIGCTLVLWGLAAWWKTRESARLRQTASPLAISETPAPASSAKTFPSGFGGLNRSAVALIVWLITVEIGVQLWYWHLESNLKPGPVWTINFPRDSSDFANIPIPADTKYLLRYDEGKEAVWTERDGTHWQVFYCSWVSGRVAGYLAKRHTPEICLPATGDRMLSGPELTMMHINGLDLPIRSYVFGTDNGPIQVFHCRWEAGASSSAYVEHESARVNLLRGIWNGRGNKGQKVLEVIISGANDPKETREAVVRELEKMITVEKS